MTTHIRESLAKHCSLPEATEYRFRYAVIWPRDRGIGKSPGPLASCLTSISMNPGRQNTTGFATRVMGPEFARTWTTNPENCSFLTTFRNLASTTLLQTSRCPRVVLIG